MIYLWSATPGTGKTCYVVKQLIEKWLVDEKNKDRKVYANIAGLKIEGIYPPPDDFRDCEDGALIIYDEAQDIKHYSSETRDDPVARALSKHRHRGFDIHFITQDPALLNKWVLKNVFLHHYLWRPAQRDNVEIFTFARAIVTPTKEDFKNAFDKRYWRFEKKYLDYYTSTVINTSQKVSSFKRNSILGLGILAFSVIGLLISLPAIFSQKKDTPTTPAPKTPQEAPQATQGAGQGGNTTQAPKTQNNATTAQNETISQDALQYLTKDELIEYVKTREKHAQNELSKYKLQVEQERLQLVMQYDTLQKQLIEHDKQIEDFYVRLELYKRQLPKNYEITKNDPALQVRAVVKRGNKCNAYNTHGDLMTLSFEECNHYLEQAGRVHKGNGQTVNVKADPVPKIMTENPNFGATPAPVAPSEPQPPS